MNRYYKPKSVTWWTLGIIPLASGAFIALEPVTGLSTWVEAVSSAAGDMTPSMLITMGTGGIGLRGAMGE